MTSSQIRSDAELLEANRLFYDPLWADARLVEPERFNTWPLVCSLVSPSRPRLEVAPGLRPRLPIEGTHFVDLSAPAVARSTGCGRNRRLVDIGMWYLSHRREKALWWYNNVFMPLGVRFQKRLALMQGMIGTADVGEVLLVCRKRSALQGHPMRA